MRTSLDFRLSTNFTWDEMTRTSVTNLQEANRAEAEVYKDALTALCQTLMEPIRARFGPIRVNSGFRGPALNAAIGGSKASQHMVGQAVDWVPMDPKIELMTIINWVRRDSGLRWGQIINEHPGNSRWIHLSLGSPWRTGRNMQVLDYDGKSYTPIK